MIAAHGDDKGPILPPKVAPIQAVIVPISNDQTREAVLEVAVRMREDLAASFTVRLDDREYLTPGRKFNEWELRGVPLRIEVGPRDIAQGQAVLARRDTSTKRVVKTSELRGEVGKELEEIQRNLFSRAKAWLEANVRAANGYEELEVDTLIVRRRGPGGLVRLRVVRGEGQAGDRRQDNQHPSGPGRSPGAVHRVR